jgi:hypothetical protein
VVAEVVVRGHRGGCDRVVVVAHTDDLRDSALDTVEALHDGRRELHRLRLMRDVRAGRVADEPVGAPVHPDVELEGLEQLEYRCDELVRDDSLLEHLHAGLDDEASVERGERRRERERLDEHRHALRGAAARHREADAGLVERVDRLDRARGERLVHADECPVHVGEQEADHFVAR